MKPTFVCPDCGVAINRGVQIVSNDNPPFERFHCESCGREGITEDLVMKRGLTVFAHRGRPHPKGQGGEAIVLNPDDFPRIWMYWGTNSSGFPIQTSPGVFDMAMVARLARWNLVTLNTRPWRVFLTPDASYPIDSLLRTANPNIKLIWYDILQDQFASSTAGSMTKAMWDFVSTGPDKRLYCQDGTGWVFNAPAPPYEVTVWWDMAATPTEAAENVAIWQAYLYGKGGDGYFVDWFNNPAYSGSVNNSPLDYARAGYASLQAIKDAIAAANVDFATRMKAIGDLLYINRGVANSNLDATSTFSICTGELFEGWDPEQGGRQSLPLNQQYPGGNIAAWNFDTAMTHGCLWQGSIATGRGTFLIKSETGVAAPNQTHLNKSMRYTAACAAICGGLSYVGNNRNGDSTGANDDSIFWADEYAVLNGASVTSGLGGKGWLGKPTEFGHLDATSGMWIRHFDRGVVVANGPGSTQQINLGKPYRRIRGFYDTSVNDGSLVQTLSVPAKDGRFLLNG